MVEERTIKHTAEVMEGISDIGVAESYAMAQGLQWTFMLQSVKCVVAYTDRQSLVNLSMTKKIRLHTRKRHKEYLETIAMFQESGIQLTINYVKGHSGDKYNTMVDKSCSKFLKTYLKKKAA